MRPMPAPRDARRTAARLRPGCARYRGAVPPRSIRPARDPGSSGCVDAPAEAAIEAMHAACRSSPHRRLRRPHCRRRWCRARRRHAPLLEIVGGQDQLDLRAGMAERMRALTSNLGATHRRIRPHRAGQDVVGQPDLLALPVRQPPRRAHPGRVRRGTGGDGESGRVQLRPVGSAFDDALQQMSASCRRRSRRERGGSHHEPHVNPRMQKGRDSQGIPAFRVAAGMIEVGSLEYCATQPATTGLAPAPWGMACARWGNNRLSESLMKHGVRMILCGSRFGAHPQSSTPASGRRSRRHERRGE